MQLFGFEIRKKDNQPGVGSVVPPSSDDGSTVVASASAYYGMVMDIEGVVKNENDLIRRYREVAQYADTDMAIEDIINEAIVSDDGAIKMNLDAIKLSDPIKKKFHAEFDTILRLLKFRERGHDIFRQWYIDGRVYYHILIDEGNIKQGIVELRQVDPRKIRRIKNVEKAKTPQGVDVTKIIDEFYLYNDKGITEQTTQGVKMTLDSIIFTPSGMIDANTGMMLSHLHKAIKPVNQLKMIEDAVVIYRISRAPERRVFYIDVGSMPTHKARAHLERIKNEIHQRRIPSKTGGGQNITDSAYNPLSIMEDYFFAQTAEGRGSKVETLPGGDNLGQIDDLRFFNNKLFRGLRVPPSYMGTSDSDAGSAYSDGRVGTAMIQEFRFTKFCERLQALVVEELDHEFKMFLKHRGVEVESSMFDIKFNPPQHFGKFRQAEVDSVMMQVYTSIADADYISKRFAMKRFLGLSEDEILENERMWREERDVNDATAPAQDGLQSMGASPPPAPDVGGPEDEFDFEEENTSEEEGSPISGAENAPEAGQGAEDITKV